MKMNILQKQNQPICSRLPLQITVNGSLSNNTNDLAEGETASYAQSYVICTLRRDKPPQVFFKPRQSCDCQLISEKH